MVNSLLKLDDSALSTIINMTELRSKVDHRNKNLILALLIGKRYINETSLKK